MCGHTRCARHGVAFEDVEEFIARRASAVATAHAIAVDLGGRGGDARELWLFFWSTYYITGGLQLRQRGASELAAARMRYLQVRGCECCDSEHEVVLSCVCGCETKHAEFWQCTAAAAVHSCGIYVLCFVPSHAERFRPSHLSPLVSSSCCLGLRSVHMQEAYPGSLCSRRGRGVMAHKSKPGYCFLRDHHCSHGRYHYYSHLNHNHNHHSPPTITTTTATAATSADGQKA